MKIFHRAIQITYAPEHRKCTPILVSLNVQPQAILETEQKRASAGPSSVAFYAPGKPRTAWLPRQPALLSRHDSTKRPVLEISGGAFWVQ